MAIQYLEDSNKEFEVVEYLKDAPTKEDLQSVLAKLGMSAEELLRKNEAVFKENFKGKSFSQDEWVEIMLSNPKLIERPIVILSDKAVVARPTERIDELG